MGGETHAETDWRWAGSQAAWNRYGRMKVWQAGVMEDSPALITQGEWQACNVARSYGRQIARLWYHLLVITLDSLLFQCKCLYLYKSHGGWVSPSAQPVWLPTIYLFIFTLYNPNGLYSNSYYRPDLTLHHQKTPFRSRSLLFEEKVRLGCS